MKTVEENEKSLTSPPNPKPILCGIQRPLMNNKSKRKRDRYYLKFFSNNKSCLKRTEVVQRIMNALCGSRDKCCQGQ